MKEEKFDLDTCVCSDDYACIAPDGLVPIEPNSFVHICICSTNPSVAISDLQINLQDEGASTNYPAVNFGAYTWNIADNNLITVREKSDFVKVSTVVIFDLFKAFENNDVASGSVLREFVDEDESKRITYIFIVFTSFLACRY